MGKFKLKFLILVGVFLSYAHSAFADPFTPLPPRIHCPGRYNVLDYILPGRNYFLETGYVFNYDVADPTVRSFKLTDVISTSNISGNLLRRIRATLPENPDANATSSPSAADIFFGFLGQTAESSISRSVGGDPSLIIGYSSNATYTPSGIKQKINESLNLGSGDGMGPSYLSEFMAIKKAVSEKAVQRFGHFQGIIYDKKGRIRGLKFRNQTFMKTPGSRGYATGNGPDSLSIFDDIGLMN